MRTYFKFRFNQVSRLLRHTGIFFMIFFLVITLGFTSPLFNKIKFLDPISSFAIGLVIILSIHFYRSDLNFLSKIFKNNLGKRKVFLAEYFLLLLPLVLVFVIKNEWTLVLGISLALISVIFLPLRSVKANLQFNWNLNWVPPHLFELKSLIRKQPWSLLIVGLTWMLTPFHISVYILSMLLIATIILSLFTESEGKELIKFDKHFLIRKISSYLLVILIIVVPVHFIAFGFYPQYLYPLVYGFISIITLTILVILYKYSLYNALYPEPLKGSFLAIIVLFFILPGLLLANIILCFYFWLKANKNLKRYA